MGVMAWASMETIKLVLHNFQPWVFAFKNFVMTEFVHLIMG